MIDHIIDILCEVKIEEDADGEYHSDGSVTDHTKYIITMTPNELDEFVSALGIIFNPHWDTAYKALTREIKRRNDIEYKP